MKPMKRLLRDYSPNWNWRLVNHPSRAMTEDIMKNGKNCSPGTSGTPKAAWFYGGEVNVNYVEALTDKFFLKESVPAGVDDL